MSRWVEGKVLGQTAWTDSLFSLFISAPIDPFIAGQFTQVGLENHSEILFRPYSFANSPDNPTIEFYYTILPTGQLTPQLMHLKVGDPVFVSRKASGRFTLEHIPHAECLWLFATGTGLGVFLSLLGTEEVWQRFNQVILVHSVRYSAELTHQEIIANLAVQHSGRFQYVPIATRDVIPGMFNARLPELLSSEALENKVGITIQPTTSQTMLCGNPSMVKDVTEALEHKGLLLHRSGNEGHITVESYWKEKK